MLRLPCIKAKPPSEEHTAAKSSFLSLEVGVAPFSLLTFADHYSRIALTSTSHLGKTTPGGAS